MDKIQEIRKALEAVTPGPWELGPGCVFVPNEVPSKRKPICVRPNDDDNAHLIANAPEWLSYLLTELDTKDRKIEVLNFDTACLKLAFKEDMNTLQQQLDTAKQENERLREQNYSIVQDLGDADAKYEFLQQQLKQAIEALEWYADLESMDIVGSERARKALSIIRKENQNAK
jgi:hypothetical protein